MSYRHTDSAVALLQRPGQERVTLGPTQQIPSMTGTSDETNIDTKEGQVRRERNKNVSQMSNPPPSFLSFHPSWPRYNSRKEKEFLQQFKE
jgi:hypothetical protein